MPSCRGIYGSDGKTPYLSELCGQSTSVKLLLQQELSVQHTLGTPSEVTWG